MFIDYYKVLGIAKTASSLEIKNAYRKLARKCHPDLNPNDKEANKKFQEINEANEVLSDSVKRKKYDTHGNDWKHENAHQQSNSQQQQYSYSNQSTGDFSDFFESMFGSSSRSRQTQFSGDDYHSELHLDLLDVYKTHKQTISVNGNNIRISIPAGIENGQTIKIRGYGAVGINGGNNGDLIIKFNITNATKFKRIQNDLYAVKKIDLYTAVLGGDITIDTCNGQVKVKVKSGTQNGTKIKLTGKGFPLYKKEGFFGDLFITYGIEIPENLNEKQKELFTELSKL